MVVTTQPRPKTHWSPCGRRENRQDYYTVRPASSDYAGYWGRKVDPDGRVRDRLSEQERRQFVEDHADLIRFINELEPVSVLDVGAGPGWMLSETRTAGKAAVEIAPEAIEVLRGAGIHVYHDLSEVPPDSQDGVIAYHVIEHLTDPLYAMHHIRRVLRKDGWLVLGTPDFGCPCAVRFGPNYRMLHDPTHVSLFTLESCSRMLRDLGFSIKRVEFPFPERLATPETFARWHDTSRMSPPWPGNWMTFFCRFGG